MRNPVRGAAAALLLLVETGVYATPKLSGEYIEVRTANVYIGACHANGEMVTAGREAILVWHVKDGTSDAGRLDGLNAVAVVAGDDNLASDKAARRAVIYVDAKATTAQQKALVSALVEKYGKALGKVVTVKSAPIEFTRQDLHYTVHIPDVANVKVARYVCHHCVMPHNIWYPPLIELKDSLVGRAALSEFKGAPELKRSWFRTNENSSYVGEFAF